MLDVFHLSADQKQMLASHHRFSALVQDFQPFAHDSEIGFLVIFLIGNGDLHPNGVSDKNRLDETQAIIAVAEGQRVYDGRSHSHGNAED